MSSSLFRVLGDGISAAHDMARKHRLPRDGVIWCWNCSDKPALMPSLHCDRCLAAHFKRMGTVGTNVNRQQNERDVEAIRGPQ